MPSSGIGLQAPRKRVLFVAPDYALGVRSGGGQRSQLLFEALNSQFSVDVLIIGWRREPRFENVFEGANRVFVARTPPPGEPFPLGMVRWVQPRRVDQIATALRSASSAYKADNSMLRDLDRIDFSSYDLVAGRYLKVLSKTNLLQTQDRPPVLIDIDDRDDLTIQNRLAEPGIGPVFRFILQRHLNRIVRTIAPLMAAGDHLWVTNNTDAQALSHRSISVLPNIPFNQPASDALIDRASDEKIVLFVGSAGHQPNLTGLLRFIKNCWPGIIRRHPDARLRVVGSGGWKRLGGEVEPSSRIDIIGECADLAPEYARAAICISPVYRGAGTKIKVLEALAYGRVVVASNHSAYGLPKELLGGPVEAAATDQAMSEACNNLLSAPETSRKRAVRGRQIVLEQFSRDRFTKIVLSDCNRILSEPSSAC